MLSKKEMQDLAYKIVNTTMKIGQKPNPHLSKIKKYKWMKGSFTLDQAVKKSGMKKKTVEKILKKYSNVIYGPLIYKRGNKYYVKDKIGSLVRVKYPPNGRELFYALRKELWKKGAEVISDEYSDIARRELAQLSPYSFLTELTDFWKFITKNVDYYLHIETRNWAGWSKGIPIDRMKAGAPVAKWYHKVTDRRQVPWLLIGWPHPSRAKELGIPYKRLERIMFDMMKFSYSPKIKKLVRDYTKAFRNKKKIRIIANDGTDLIFSLKGRRLNKDTAYYDEAMREAGDVGGNLPTGEIFFAPVENSAEGTIVFPKASIPGEGMAEHLVLTFKNGRVVKTKARKGDGYLDNFIKKNLENADTIAEFGIGLNEQAVFTGGEIIIDEKIFGSIHIAIGWNAGYGGKTNAAEHLDFIKDLRKCNGKVYGDGKLLIDKGHLINR